MFLMPARAVTQNYKMTLKNQRFKGLFLFWRGESHYFNLTGSKILASVCQISVAFPEVIQCILYKLKTDCQWHMLPVSSFFTGRVLHYKTMYGHLRKWSRNGEWEKSQDDFYINITIVLSDCTKILNSFGYFSLAT